MSELLTRFVFQDTDVPYDMKYALRLCSEHKKEEACVHIYSAMKLYEEAVDLALKVWYLWECSGMECDLSRY